MDCIVLKKKKKGKGRELTMKENKTLEKNLNDLKERPLKDEELEQVTGGYRSCDRNSVDFTKGVTRQKNDLFGR